MQPRLCRIQVWSPIWGIYERVGHQFLFSPLHLIFANRFPFFRMLPKFVGPREFLVTSSKLITNHPNVICAATNLENFG